MVNAQNQTICSCNRNRPPSDRQCYIAIGGICSQISVCDVACINVIPPTCANSFSDLTLCNNDAQCTSLGLCGICVPGNFFGQTIFYCRYATQICPGFVCNPVTCNCHIPAPQPPPPPDNCSCITGDCANNCCEFTNGQCIQTVNCMGAMCLDSTSPPHCNFVSQSNCFTDGDCNQTGQCSRCVTDPNTNIRYCRKVLDCPGQFCDFSSCSCQGMIPISPTEPVPSPVPVPIPSPVPIEPVPVPIEPVPVPIEPVPTPIEPAPIEPAPIEPVPIEPIPVPSPEPMPIGPIAPTAPIEPTEPIEPIEPIEPTEPTEPVEPTPEPIPVPIPSPETIPDDCTSCCSKNRKRHIRN